MPFNLPGILVPFHLLVHPRLVLPAIVVKDIRQIDFPALYSAGYRGAVFDKDNCLTVPHEDRLVPELVDAWRECRETFGPDNVLIVSNTAGSHLDIGSIEAESVSHHLSAPVLRHSALKPSYACINAVRAYFASLPRPVRDDELVVVGDRLFTDVVMANRMARRVPSSPSSLPSPLPAESDSEKTKLLLHDDDANGAPARPAHTGPLAIWTTRLWKRENGALRALERAVLEGVERGVLQPQERAWREGLRRRFVRPVQGEEGEEKAGEGKGKEGWVGRLVRRFRG
ncbi:mitochondrial PGP phosphatase-domain-containing protein [Cubamyces menziesii]|nr:mitochondrial PGP phosphatase-domain-containing protein [Cubamyces menziesii]